MQTNSRTAIAGGFNPNFFNEVQEEEEALEQFSYYPNPVKDRLNISTKGLMAESLQLELYNLQGVLLYKGTHQTSAASNSVSLKTDELKQGVYLLRIKANGQEHNLKISKE